MSYNTQTPYIASYVLVRRGDTVAFVLRSNTGWMNGYYGLPSGKVEKGESFRAAAVREAKEETGIDVNPEHLKHALTVHRHETGSDAPEWVDIYFEVAEWSGQPHNAEPKIHSELAWLDVNNLPENIVPSVRSALEQMKQGKVYSEYGWEPQRR